MDTKSLLKRLLKEVEDEEELERLEGRFQALEAKLEEKGSTAGTVTLADITGLLKNASQEELDALEDTLLGKWVREEEARREKEAGAGDGKGDDRGDNKGDDKGAKKTRPGRRQGKAYDWDTDTDGRIVPLEVARVWNEPDEPETIEVPEDEKPADDEEGKAA